MELRDGSIEFPNKNIDYLLLRKTCKSAKVVRIDNIRHDDAIGSTIDGGTIKEDQVLLMRPVWDSKDDRIVPTGLRLNRDEPIKPELVLCRPGPGLLHLL